MYHHVGVTTNRRGEVGIVGESKTIVPDIVGRINRFGHGTNGEGLDERLSRFTLAVIQERIDMFVGSFAIAGEFEVETKTLDEIAQLAYFFGIRVVMNTINEWFGFFILNYFNNLGTIN